MLLHSGSVISDSEEESAFIAFSISITTRIERDIVEADLAISFENILQSTSGKEVEQL